MVTVLRTMMYIRQTTLLHHPVHSKSDPDTSALQSNSQCWSLTPQVVGHWIDRKGSHPRWKDRVVERAKRGNLASGVITQTISQLAAGKIPGDIQLYVTKPTLRDRSVQWFVEAFKLINEPAIIQQAFSLCTAGIDSSFNLSFDSLTSVEARRTLRDLPRTAPDIKDAAATVSVPEDTVNDEEEPGGDAPLELLLQFVASGKKCASDGYRIDADRSLIVHTAADCFEEVPASVSNGEPIPLGRGKCRHVTNKQYGAFEEH
ncbi:hypothetical protein BDR03DRAFT_979694 [Suillus americanus]|nr:hypothetical protein BDR03DRAFT_979694 [Suillus americanus]